jgi:hypothetical protein
MEGPSAALPPFRPVLTADAVGVPAAADYSAAAASSTLAGS